MLTVAQLLGGIAGAGLVSVLTPYGGTGNVQTKLQPGIDKGQGLMIEAFLTAILVFSVLMLAAEKHKSTYLAPIGIGLTIFACHREWSSVCNICFFADLSCYLTVFGVLWTGCGINPARAIGPSVVAREFVSLPSQAVHSSTHTASSQPGYFWIYVIGPMIGSFMAVAFYAMLKAMDYTQIVFGQDADHVVGDESNAIEAAEKGEAGGGEGDKQQRPSNTRSSTAKSAKKASKKLVLRRDRVKDVGQASGVTADGNDLSTIVAQEWVLSDEEQQEAIKKGDAVIIEMDTLRDVVAEQLETGFPSMAPYAQDAGGIQAPGTVVIG